MKIISNSSLPTSNMRPTVAKRIIARYSPGSRRDLSDRARHTVKRASPRQMILKSEVSGVITSIPPKGFVFRGNISTAAIAMTIPRPATNEHQTVEVRLGRMPAAPVGGFAGDTPATTVARPLISPIVSTTRALITTMASGDASLRSSRYDVVEATDFILETSSLQPRVEYDRAKIWDKVRPQAWRA